MSVGRQHKTMKGSSSLAEQLRAIRSAPSDRLLLNAPSHQDAAEHAWQEEIARVRQSLEDVIRAVYRLSGVELSGLEGQHSSDVNFLPLLEGETLKDRIRDDLESFSLTTAADLVRQAEEQARNAMGVLQRDFKVQVEHLSKELRDGLREQFRPDELEIDLSQETRDRVAEMVERQTDEFAHWVWLNCKGRGKPITSQIEILLEPYAKEVSGKFLASFRQHILNLLTEQEQLLEETIHGKESLIEDELESLLQTSRLVCEQNADSIARCSTERMNAAADELVKGFEGRSASELGGAFGRFQARLAEDSAAAQEVLQREYERREENFRQRLEALADGVREKSLSEMSGRIEDSAAGVIETSVQHLHHQAGDSLDHSREEIVSYMKLQGEEARLQVEEHGLKAHESLLGEAARAAENLRVMENETAASCERHIAASKEQVAREVQGWLDSIAERMEQLDEIYHKVRGSQETGALQYASRLQQATESCFDNVAGRIQQAAGEASSRVKASVQATFESVMRDLSDGVNVSVAVLRQEVGEATSRIESVVSQSLQDYRQQLAESSDEILRRQNKVMAGNLIDLHNRLIRAAEMLAPDHS
jgi:hypothetical protein